MRSKDFYNHQRCHYALHGEIPTARAGKAQSKIADLSSYRWQSHCRDLYLLAVAA